MNSLVTVDFVASPAVIGVLKSVGAIAFTRTRPIHSSASARVSCTTAPFVAR